MFYGYVQQSGLYETLDLVITDRETPEYNDYYKNNEQWYLSKKLDNIKDLIEHLWFVYNKTSEVSNIKLYLEDTYFIEDDTIKIMFAERFIV